MRTTTHIDAGAREIARLLARQAARYPDDPVGDYETTSGGW